MIPALNKGQFAFVPVNIFLQKITDAAKDVYCLLYTSPKQMNNEASENMKNIEPFVRSLKKKLPDMPV